MLIYSAPFFLVFGILSAMLIGLVAGSFLNCVAWRIAHGESFLKGRSHCVKCGHVLSALDLVPLFSWIFSGGKCRYCKEKISVRYPLTEAVMALLSVLCILATDYSLLTLRNWLFICCLFTLSLVDLEIMEIPNGTIIAGIIIWAGFLFFLPEPLLALKNGLIGAVAFGGGILLISLVLDKVLKKDSLGGGDIKLVFTAGLYLGALGSLFMIFLACLIGLVLMPVMKKHGDEKGGFPFGPSIAGATCFMLLYGNILTEWYTGLF